jgi:hypothetical protein
MFEDVFRELPEHLKKQRAQLRAELDAAAQAKQGRG